MQPNIAVSAVGVGRAFFIDTTTADTKFSPGKYGEFWIQAVLGYFGGIEAIGFTRSSVFDNGL